MRHGKTRAAFSRDPRPRGGTNVFRSTLRFGKAKNEAFACVGFLLHALAFVQGKAASLSGICLGFDRPGSVQASPWLIRLISIDRCTGERGGTVGTLARRMSHHPGGKHAGPWQRSISHRVAGCVRHPVSCDAGLGAGGLGNPQRASGRSRRRGASGGHRHRHQHQYKRDTDQRDQCRGLV